MTKRIGDMMEVKADTNRKFFVQDIPCTIQLQLRQWKVVFNYHGEKVCLKICREGSLPECYVRTAAEWMVEEYLEDRRVEELCQVMN